MCGGLVPAQRWAVGVPIMRPGRILGPGGVGVYAVRRWVLHAKHRLDIVRHVQGTPLRLCGLYLPIKLPDLTSSPPFFGEYTNSTGATACLLSTLRVVGRTDFSTCSVTSETCGCLPGLIPPSK
jgi:hypothetical protein